MTLLTAFPSYWWIPQYDNLSTTLMHFYQHVFTSICVPLIVSSKQYLENKLLDNLLS